MLGFEGVPGVMSPFNLVIRLPSEELAPRQKFSSPRMNLWTKEKKHLIMYFFHIWLSWNEWYHIWCFSVFDLMIFLTKWDWEKIQATAATIKYWRYNFKYYIILYTERPRTYNNNNKSYPKFCDTHKKKKSAGKTFFENRLISKFRITVFNFLKT